MIRLFQSSLPADFHRGLTNELKRRYEPGFFARARKWRRENLSFDFPSSFSDNGLFDPEDGHGLKYEPFSPYVRAIQNDAAVVNAVTQMLGLGAGPDDCMHLHRNGLAEDGPWHQDDYCGRNWPTDRDIAILCYFPQDTPPEMGPTEVRWDGMHQLASGPAGTCLLMRNDVEHRATANCTGRQRYMLKFLFAVAPEA